MSREESGRVSSGSSGMVPLGLGTDEREEIGRRKAELAKRLIEELIKRMGDRRRRVIRLEDRVQEIEDEVERSRIRREHSREESRYARQRNRISVKDFEPMAELGRGSAGVVTLVRWRARGILCAMKQINKSDLRESKMTHRAWVERNVLGELENPFLAKMYCSFQDESHLYFIMEFLAGGDLLSLLIREGTVPEEKARFLLAEIVMAVNAVHTAGYIHRDIKPDNILFDEEGHVKLTDFGLAKDLAMRKTEPANIRRSLSLHRGEALEFLAKMTTQQRREAWRAAGRDCNFSSVGTPNYVAPEVLLDETYGEECDWWSVGALMYEMLYGFPPFHSDSIEVTTRRIVNWERTLRFPEDVPVSREGRDLMQRLLCSRFERIGTEDGLQDFRKHPFFHGIPWDSLPELEAVYPPEFSNGLDLRYFADARECNPKDLLEVLSVLGDELKENDEIAMTTEMSTGDSQSASQSDIKVLDSIEDLQFAGFTYRRYGPVSSRKSLKNDLFSPLVLLMS